jgi:hypothetical protein
VGGEFCFPETAFFHCVLSIFFTLIFLGSMFHGSYSLEVLKTVNISLTLKTLPKDKKSPLLETKQKECQG